MREREMGGPVRPPWGELDAVVRSLVAQGATLEQVLEAAAEVALEEDLDERRALDRARALWSSERDEEEE